MRDKKLRKLVEGLIDHLGVEASEYYHADNLYSYGPTPERIEELLRNSRDMSRTLSALLDYLGVEICKGGELKKKSRSKKSVR